MQKYKINTEYIELFKLLKAVNLANSGGEAKVFIEQSLVKVDGEIELRKKCKLRPGQIVEFENTKIMIE